MEEVIQLLKGCFYEMGNVGVSMELCVAAMLFLLFEKTKEKNSFILYSLLPFIIVLNPLSYNNITTFWFFDDYWKMFLVVTPIVCIAYAFTELICETKARWLRCLMTISCAFIIGLSVRFEFEPAKIRIPENTLGVADEILELDDVLKSAEIPLMNVIAPREVIGAIREVDANISFLYSEALIQKVIDQSYHKENETERSFAEVCSVIVAVPSAVENQINTADLYGGNCIILETEYDDELLMQNRGFKKIGSTESYIVYVRN